MIEIISGTFAAGETKTFMINGEYLEILDCQYTCDVMLMDRAGAQLSIMKGCEASFFSRPKEGYNTIQIYSPQAQFIRVFLGSGDAGTRRISSTVQVIDGGRSRSIAGAAFAMSAVVTPASTKFGAIQLWNPALSGRRLVVKASRYSCSLANAYGLAFKNTKLPTAAPGSIVGKMFGASGVAEVYSEANSAAQVVADSASLATAFLGASQGDAVTFAEPVIVLPGQGLIFYCSTAGICTILATLEFTEESLI